MTDQIIKIDIKYYKTCERKKAAVVMVFYCNPSNNCTARFTCLAIYSSKCSVLGTSQNVLEVVVGWVISINKLTLFNEGDTQQFFN